MGGVFAFGQLTTFAHLGCDGSVGICWTQCTITVFSSVRARYVPPLSSVGTPFLHVALGAGHDRVVNDEQCRFDEASTSTIH